MCMHACVKRQSVFAIRIWKKGCSLRVQDSLPCCSMLRLLKLETLQGFAWEHWHDSHWLHSHRLLVLHSTMLLQKQQEQMLMKMLEQVFQVVFRPKLDRRALIPTRLIRFSWFLLLARKAPRFLCRCTLSPRCYSSSSPYTEKHLIIITVILLSQKLVVVRFSYLVTTHAV